MSCVRLLARCKIGLLALVIIAVTRFSERDQYSRSPREYPVSYFTRSATMAVTEHELRTA